jgi:hypothetical protein
MLDHEHPKLMPDDELNRAQAEHLRLATVIHEQRRLAREGK